MTMTKKLNMHLSWFLVALLLSACDGFGTASVEVNPEVQDMTEVLVINAEIERGKIAWAHISYTEDINALVTTPQKFENKATVTLSVDDGKSEVLRLVTAKAAADAGIGYTSGDGGVDSGQPDAAKPDAGQPDAGVDQGAPDSGTPDIGKPDIGKPDAGKAKPDAGKGKPDAGKSTNTLADKGLYVGSTIVGEEGKTYTLTVKIGAKTYTAKCEMFKEPGISWFAINGMTNRGQYIDYSVTSGTGAKGGKSGTGGYSEEWHVMDPKDTRDRYLFEYYLNGVHLVAKDWCIDDNRVVNTTDKISKKEGLKLFNVTINPAANQYLNFRVSEVDKPTYDYFNMYEKIMRGLIGPGSVTPYNPKSNFSGERTVGNFRAVSFSATPGLAPPTPCATSKSGTVTLQFEASPVAPDGKTAYFKKYHLYWSAKEDVDHTSSKVADIQPTSKGGKVLIHTLKSPVKGVGYYRLQVEDKDGFVSPLSPVATGYTTKDLDGCGGGSSATTPCGDLKAKCDPKTAKPCIAKDKKTYVCSSKGTWTEMKTSTQTCGGVTKKCQADSKTGWCHGEDGEWYQCKNGKWDKYGGGGKK